MDSSTWQRIEQLFLEALDRDPAERRAFLDEACGQDLTLRQEIEAMLGVGGDGEGDGLAIERTLLNEGQGRTFEETSTSRAGSRVGAWRLERLLGRGGMGEVWLAARADGGFEQKCAVKLVRPGWRAAELAANFGRERQLLARLVHPNIARLLDGGVTEDGSPFLAMEFVDGEPITAWCGARRLPIRERLALFRVVCAAVRFAHANLVVHRDLKPANILVTADGRPILLDFGIAKLLDPDLSGSAPTRGDDRLLTPEYAAPEQLRGEPTTVATDVWALGALLFELLAGRRPFDTSGRSIQAIEQMVCHEPPPPPSAVADPQSSAALRGDLDAIVGNALRSEPDRRYASVEQLAEDLDRYLADLPVRARPDTVGYRIRKSVRRHRTAFLAGCAFVGLVLTFAASSLHQASSVARERDRAVTANHDSEEAIAMLVDLFRLANPKVTAGGDTLRVDDLVGLMTERLEHSEESPRVRAKLWSTLAEVHHVRTRLDEAEAATLRGMAAAEEAQAEPELLHLRHQRAVIVQFRDGAAAAEPLLRESVRQHERYYGVSGAELAPVLQDWTSTLTDRDAAARVLDRVLPDCLAAPGGSNRDRRRLQPDRCESLGARRARGAGGVRARLRHADPGSGGGQCGPALDPEQPGAVRRPNRAFRGSGAGPARDPDQPPSHLRRTIVLGRGKLDEPGRHARAPGEIPGSGRGPRKRGGHHLLTIGADHAEVLAMQSDLASALVRGGRPEEGFALYDRLINHLQAQAVPESTRVMQLQLARTRGRLHLGLPTSIAQARRLTRQVRGTANPGLLANALETEGLIALTSPDSGNAAEARAALREAIELRRSTQFAEHPSAPFLSVAESVARAAAGVPIDRDSLAASLRQCERWGMAHPGTLRRARRLLAD
ncbi:MAG: serine/threonine protein kinase [Candidatus Eisenbacteria bacterium]|nr:serine/threonine protein kinase [Candidatus Eisenbacteria bacterium]